MNITGNYPQSVAKRHLNIRLGKMLQPAAKSEDDELLPYLRAANVTWGAVDHSDTKEMWFSPDDREKYGVSNGDLLVLEGGDVGRAAIASDVGQFLGIQNSLHRVRPKKGNEIRFAYYWMQHLSAFGYFDLVCSKATLAHFTSEKFAVTPYPQVDDADQKQIADFLDRETALIDQLIEQKQRFVDIQSSSLKSLLQSLVLGGATVRRGLDGDWLQELPSGWKLTPLKHLVSVMGGATPSKDREDFWTGDIPWISPKDMKTDVIADVPDHLSVAAVENSAVQLIPADAVLIVVRGMILSRTVPICRLGVTATINQDMKALIPKQKSIEANYLQRMLQGFEDVLMSFIEEAAHGTKKLRSEALFGIKFPIPPIDQQRSICSRYEQARVTSEKLSSKTSASINRLREFRSALITAAVTGQIDVTTWGKQGQTDRRLDKIQEEMGA